jgi:chemotaxis response regulator CheB
LTATFPIVGIGASAGGLEALDLFMSHVPLSCGMAFVVIQHLAPDYKGIMPELLQRTTAMKVFQIKERMKVQPDCVYVIPPNKEVTILSGILHLTTPAAARGLRLPIDCFLRSLAQDQQAGSIGVILSGMGSDGMQGLAAIKQSSGLTLVQTPATAKFDGMPTSAINAGLADYTCAPDEMPAAIIAHLKHAPIFKPIAAVVLDENDVDCLD